MRSFYAWFCAVSTVANAAMLAMICIALQPHIGAIPAQILSGIAAMVSLAVGYKIAVRITGI